jgi:hypothetical protein
LIAGVLIGFLTRLADGRLRQANLPSTSIFAGIMCIAMLRSRSQDLLSYLLTLIIFLLLIRPVMSWGSCKEEAGRTSSLGSAGGPATETPMLGA